MTSSLDDLLISSVQLSSAWLAEFFRQNYIYIIMLMAALAIIWLMGVLIKGWMWKVDKISESLDKIAVSLDYLVRKTDSEKKQTLSDNINFKESVVANQEQNHN